MKKVLQEKNYFKSSDLCLVSCLSYFRYQVHSISRENPSKVVFAIQKDEKLDELVRQYFAHELMVEPLGFFNFLKEIKTRIYNVDR